MTTLQEIIDDAFRESNILPLNKAPNAAQSAEALRLLLQLFTVSYGDEAGEAFQDWPLGTYGQVNPTYPLTNDYYRQKPPLNMRLVALNEAEMTVYFPSYPQDGSRMAIIDPFGRLAAFPVTLDGNGRPIEGSTNQVANTNGLNREWFYRADLGNWVRLTDLTATDQMPFPKDFDTFFSTSLAMRLNPRYGRKMDELTAAVYKAERSKFINRYLQAMPLHIDDSLSWPFMSTQSYNQPSVFSSDEAFNRGIGWR